MRATLMRERAGGLRAAGDRDGAEQLERKARLQERFGRGQDIARPSRFTATSRATRRQAHRQALTEVAGMHALERDARTQQVAADEARLPMVQRDLALAGSTGGDTATLHQEQQAIGERLATNRARLQELAPREDGSPSPATRAAASALANERLEPGLRSHQYVARISAGRGSPFARRIAGAGARGARDELARSRAHAVRVAQTPPDQRAPAAPLRPARPPSAAGKRRDERTSRPGPNSPTIQRSVEQPGAASAAIACALLDDRTAAAAPAAGRRSQSARYAPPDTARRWPGGQRPGRCSDAAPHPTPSRAARARRGVGHARRGPTRAIAAGAGRTAGGHAHGPCGCDSRRWSRSGLSWAPRLVPSSLVVLAVIVLVVLLIVLIVSVAGAAFQSSTAVWPVPIATDSAGAYQASGWAISSRFGWRDDPRGGGAEFHDGIDLANPQGRCPFGYHCGTPAMFDGQVQYVGWDMAASGDPSKTGGGEMVILQERR